MPDKLQLYGLYVYNVVQICNSGMLRVKKEFIIIEKLIKVMLPNYSH